MARFKWGKKNDRDASRPEVSNDFIYDDPDEKASVGADASGISDTPEEALRKMKKEAAEKNGEVSSAEEFLRRQRGRRRKSEPVGGIRTDELSGSRLEDEDTDKKERAESGEAGSADSIDEFRRQARSGSYTAADRSGDESSSRRREHTHPLLRRLILILITFILIFCAGAFIFHRIIPTAPVLGEPENLIGRIVTPVQTFFSGLTEAVAGYFRTMKLRANIETEYNALRAENEQLVYKAMLAEELQNTLSQYEDLSDEIKANAEMKPIVCTVIGKSDSNYFSTFTINKGTNDGVEDYMAVTVSGALVGYTESVQATKSTVRTIIDSEASIAGLIQSSRDQGTVRGTLGIDGTAMCRMYYLPDDNLPRPGDTVVTSGVGMSFPKGIPIGTVRESTRGMESNKQYIVLEPAADFQHLEYVIVLRYKPQAEAIEGRENGRTNVELVPLESARPSPEVPQIASSLFESQNTQDPNVTPTPTPEPTETPTPSPTPTEIPTVTPEVNNLVYQVVQRNAEPTATPTPSPAPTPTPYLTPDPELMTFEEDE